MYDSHGSLARAELQSRLFAVAKAESTLASVNRKVIYLFMTARYLPDIETTQIGEKSQLNL